MVNPSSDVSNEINAKVKLQHVYANTVSRVIQFCKESITRTNKIMSD